MAHVWSPLWVGQGGLSLLAAAGLVRCGYALAEGKLSLRAVNRLRGVVLGLVGLAVMAEFLLTTWYLRVPGFMDHIEASVASDVHYFLAGLPVYPATNQYTFHGLLYGPLLVELNSLGYFIHVNPVAAKVVGWLAAWAALWAILATFRLDDRSWSGVLGPAYGLSLLVAFGGELTTDRSESMLLLCACLALICGRWRNTRLAIPLLGALCGTASALKLHGPLYCVPGLYLCAAQIPREVWRSRQVMIWAGYFLVAAIGSGLLPFLPSNVSLSGYWQYLVLALKHGASLRLFLLNCAFVIGIWSPLLLLMPGLAQLRRLSAASRALAASLFASEALVVAVASKPGAGVHHLLPFLAAHAYLFQRTFLETRVSRDVPLETDLRAVAAVGATLLGMTFPALHTLGELAQFNRRATEQAAERDELLRFWNTYPRGMLGVAGIDSYSLATLRPWLTLHGALQTDYGAFMDLKLSGVSDAPLREAFDNCAIPFVYMPRPGEPFSLPSNYGGPLFSGELRAHFADRYRLIAHGAYFDVFSCRRPPPNDGHSQVPPSVPSQMRSVPSPRSTSGAST